MDNGKLNGAIKKLGDILPGLLAELKEKQDFMRRKISDEMPEFLKEYDQLMNDVLERRKTSEDVANFMQKYNRVLSNKKGGDNLNRK